MEKSYISKLHDHIKIIIISTELRKHYFKHSMNERVFLETKQLYNTHYNQEK